MGERGHGPESTAEGRWSRSTASGSLMVALDALVVSSALTTIAGDLHALVAELQSDGERLDLASPCS